MLQEIWWGTFEVCYSVQLRFSAVVIFFLVNKTKVNLWLTLESIVIPKYLQYNVLFAKFLQQKDIVLESRDNFFFYLKKGDYTQKLQYLLSLSLYGGNATQLNFINDTWWRCFKDVLGIQKYLQ